MTPFTALKIALSVLRDVFHKAGINKSNNPSDFNRARVSAFDISLTRFVLNDDQKRLFEKLSIYCDRYAELIPVSFVLGELWLTNPNPFKSGGHH